VVREVKHETAVLQLTVTERMRRMGTRAQQSWAGARNIVVEQASDVAEQVGVRKAADLGGLISGIRARATAARPAGPNCSVA